MPTNTSISATASAKPINNDNKMFSEIIALIIRLPKKVPLTINRSFKVSKFFK